MRSHPHLLFVFSGPPKQGTGSQVIVDRHLRRLTSKDWKISILVPEHTLIGENFPDSWQIIPLPMRRWWWPPFRPEIPGVLELRLRCWQLECEQVLQGERPSAILTILWSVYSLLAAHLSKAWKTPLSVMIHDRQEFWAKTETENRLLKQCSIATLNQAARVWSVSQELGDAYKVKTKNISILLPIPEDNCRDFVEWKDHFKAHPVVAHAGSLHPFQLYNFQSLASALKKINGTLLIVAPASNPVLLKLLETCSNVKCREPFTQNTDVMNFLAANASCIVVSYSFDLTQQPWAVTSFPSKLVEFAHLGLPILILAPPNTASSNWAESHRWRGYVSKIDEEELFKNLNQLLQKETWIKMAEQSRNVALNEFNPNYIHTQFESELATAKLENY